MTTVLYIILLVKKQNMPPKRASRNAAKVISLDDEPGPSTAAAGARATRSKAAAAPAPQPTPAPKPAPKPKPAIRAAKGIGKEKVVTIESTTRQIDANANLAPDTQSDYSRKFAFIAKCLKTTDAQKLINQPDKVIAYIRDRYTNLNSRTGYAVAVVSMMKHSTLKVTDEVQQKYFDFMMQSANAVQEKNKDNVHKVDEVMLNGKRVVLKDILNLEAKMRKEKKTSKDHSLVAVFCLISPRRLKDYCKMKLFKSKAENDRTDALNKVWLDTRMKCAHMSISEYKTAKDKGTYTAKITGVLYEIIKTSLSEHKLR